MPPSGLRPTMPPSGLRPTMPRSARPCRGSGVAQPLTVGLVDETEWADAVTQLETAADAVHVLSRCLAVKPHLMRFRADGNELEGHLAADALDQALGDLERLAEGGARELAALVERLLEGLPTPLE